MQYNLAVIYFLQNYNLCEHLYVVSSKINFKSKYISGWGKRGLMIKNKLTAICNDIHRNPFSLRQLCTQLFCLLQAQII